MKLSPNYGAPYAETDDARRDFPTTVDQPRTLTFDRGLAQIGESCLYNGPFSALAAGANIISLTTLLAGDAARFPLVGGAVTVPAAGIWLLIYDLDITGLNTELYISPATAFTGEWAGIKANTVNGLAAAQLHSTITYNAAAAGAVLPKPRVYGMPNGGGTGNVRLTAIYQGKGIKP